MLSARKLKRIAGGLLASAVLMWIAALALGAHLVGDDGDAGLLRELQVRRHQERLQREHGVGAVEALAGLEEGAHRRGRMAEEALARA